MLLRDVMTTNLVSVSPEESASNAWSLMDQERIRHLVVLEEDELVGVLSIRDLGGRNDHALREGRTVSELMTSRVLTATPETTLDEAFAIMQERPLGSLPIIDDGKLVGIVTATDVLDELARARDAGRSGPRERARKPDSPTRAPFADQIPRAAKRNQGRTTAAEVPAYIRSVGPVLDVVEREAIRRKLGRKLGKFAYDIERASVRVEDVNGPRGGVDKQCRIKVVLSGQPSVVVEEKHHDLRSAVDGALSRAERAVRRAVEKRKSTH